MMMQKHSFADEKFLSAIQKEKILKNWYKFIKTGFKKGNFTVAIYEHLHIHCGFIAHYNRQGFYDEYFVDPHDTIRFMEYFENECPLSWRLFKDDLTSVMMQELDNIKSSILKTLNITNLKICEIEFELSKRNLQDARNMVETV